MPLRQAQRPVAHRPQGELPADGRADPEARPAVAPTDADQGLPLKHMSAIDAERTIRHVLRRSARARRRASAAGLGTRVHGDRRVPRNSLIVQASPRDMLEDHALIDSSSTSKESGAPEQRSSDLQASQLAGRTRSPRPCKKRSPAGVGGQQASNSSSNSRRAAKAAQPRRRRDPASHEPAVPADRRRTASSSSSRAFWPTCGSRPTRGATR